MIVSAWTNGSGTYGLRIGKPNVREHFPKSRREVEIVIEGRVCRYPLSDTFWTSCPEHRGGRISAWLKEKGLTSWPSGEPPSLKLEPLEEGRFRLAAPDEMRS